MAATTRTSRPDVVAAADAPERLLLEEAQQLGLQRQRHLADLVEEHRAAVGLLEQADLALARVGEGAALVAEQLALEQGIGQRRAGDVRERLVRAVADGVQCARGDVLADAGLAGDQHGRRAALREARTRRLTSSIGGDSPSRGCRGCVGVAREQRAHLALKLRGLERAMHEDRDVIDIERLGHEVERAFGTSPRPRAARWCAR